MQFLTQMEQVHNPLTAVTPLATCEVNLLLPIVPAGVENFISAHSGNPLLL